MALGLFTSLIQAFFVNGIPANGANLYTYAAGTSTPLATYIDSTGGTPFTNPIQMNARGEPETALGASAGIWGTVGTPAKFILKDTSGNTLWTIDNVYPSVSATFTGDSGSGGAGGIVPAPPSGSAAAAQFLAASGAWAPLTTVVRASPTAADVGFLGMPARSISASSSVQQGDLGSAVVNTSASPITFTLTPDSGVNYPANSLSIILLVNPAASGAITVAQGSGVSLFGPPSNNTAANRTLGANGQAALVRFAANTWNIVGAGVS